MGETLGSLLRVYVLRHAQSWSQPSTQSWLLEQLGATLALIDSGDPATASLREECRLVRTVEYLGPAARVIDRGCCGARVLGALRGCVGRPPRVVGFICTFGLR